MLRELKEHDVARIKVDSDVLALETVDKVIHLLGRHEIAIEKDVLDVEGDAELLCQGNQLADRFPRPAVAYVVRYRIVVFDPGSMNRSGDDQDVLRAQVVCRGEHELGQFETTLPLAGDVAGQRVGPVEESAQPTDGDA